MEANKGCSVGILKLNIQIADILRERILLSEIPLSAGLLAFRKCQLAEFHTLELVEFRLSKKEELD